MPASGWKSVTLREEILEKLTDIYKKDQRRPRNQKFSAWFEDKMIQFTEYDENLERYGKFLDYQGAIDNRITVYDYKLDKDVTLYVDPKSKKLRCKHHNKTDCMHVGFAFAVPEVYNTLVKRGFKPPQEKGNF